MFSVDTQTHFPWASVELEVELLAWITGLLNMSLDKIAFCLTAIILNKQHEGLQLHFAGGKLRHKECDFTLDQLQGQKRSSPGPHSILSLLFLATPC